jgi:hypothetical protein
METIVHDERVIPNRESLTRGHDLISSLNCNFRAAFQHQRRIRDRKTNMNGGENAIPCNQNRLDGGTSPGNLVGGGLCGVT